MHLISAHKGRVCALAYSPDGKLLASGGEDRKVRVWDSSTRGEAAAYKGHKGCVYALAFSPDGTLLASGGGRNELFLWDLAARTRATLAGHTVLVAGAAFDPGGAMLATAAGNVFDSMFDGEVRLWSPEHRDAAWQARVPGGAWAVAFDPVTQALAVGTGHRRVELRRQVGLRNPGTEEPVVLDCGTAVRGLAYAPDGGVLAAATGWAVQLWDAGTHRRRHALKGHTSVVWSVAYTRNGRLLSGAEDGLVKVWDTATGSEVKSFDWGIGKVRAVAVAPDELTAAAAGDGAVAVWDIED